MKQNCIFWLIVFARESVIKIKVVRLLVYIYMLDCNKQFTINSIKRARDLILSRSIDI